MTLCSRTSFFHWATKFFNSENVSGAVVSNGPRESEALFNKSGVAGEAKYMQSGMPALAESGWVYFLLRVQT